MVEVGAKARAAALFAAIVVGAVGAAATDASSPGTLVKARAIRAQTDARYRRSVGLAVTEASSTRVVESFSLATPDLLGVKTLPAANGIWYAVCPVRATCPYPARGRARSAVDPASRRLALELATRTFLETSADVVAVSLPTVRFTAFVVEREELRREIDLVELAASLRGGSGGLGVVVDRVMRPRTFLGLGLEPTPTGRHTWAGIPLWPTI